MPTAALMEKVPFANGAPNLSVDLPCMVQLAKKNCVPISGKDFKTGQTLMKTIVAPGLKERLIGVSGWFSTNILGNRDGEVLDDPESFKSKEVSKSGVLDTICNPNIHPDLYSNILPQDSHQLLSAPRRRQGGVGTISISSVGMDYPMQIKKSISSAAIRFWPHPSCSTSRSSATWPSGAGWKGIQEWMSFFYKSPQTADGLYPEHDLFIQKIKFKNTLRHMAGEELITHLGLEYYQDEE